MTGSKQRRDERTIFVPYVVTDPPGLVFEEPERDDDEPRETRTLRDGERIPKGWTPVLDEDGYPLEVEHEPRTVLVRVRLKAGDALIGVLPSVARMMRGIRSFATRDSDELDPQVMPFLYGLLEVIVTRKDAELWASLLNREFRGFAPGHGPAAVGVIADRAECRVNLTALWADLQDTLKIAEPLVGEA